MSAQPVTPLHSFLIRTADVVLALIVLAVFALPMALVALLVRREDGGPALFVQRRIGKDCAEFRILKFRTMRVDPGAGAGDVRGEGAEALVEARTRFRTTEVGDSRITRIGKPLRRMHIDELPQMINVLAGQMSLVGVRPDTPAQQGDYSPAYWRERHALRPGITGPAQLHNVGSLDERARLERLWLARPTFGSYVGVLFATVGKVLRRSGI